MSNIDKEWLKQKIADMEAARDEIPFGLDEDDSNTLAAMKLALASLEAEAVAYVDPFAFHNFSVYRAGETDNKRMGREWMWANPDAGLIPVYTAPPAPVSVPDRSMFEKWWESEHGSPLDSWDSLRTTDGYCDDGIDGQFEAWNACRAAMLQGADGNSPLIPDGWVACSERMPETMVSVLVTGTWFHHAVAFWDGLSWCDLDFEPPVTHWQPLPAAPQQEVR